jgi:regulatory protein
VNGHRKPRRPVPPLNEAKLQELALAYVGRFATTRAKLRAYLARKVRERGWSGEREPNLEALANRFAERGYIDDAAYALSKAQGLTARGYGKRRIVEKLRIAGVEEDDSAAAREHAHEKQLAAALRFAERRKIGPFARENMADRNVREKAIAAMVRAGHPFGLARAIVEIEPGASVDMDELAERARMAPN